MIYLIKNDYKKNEKGQPSSKRDAKVKLFYLLNEDLHPFFLNNLLNCKVFGDFNVLSTYLVNLLSIKWVTSQLR